MNDLTGGDLMRQARPESAFRFTGTWREFLPIALSNLALTLVTLGIYRFWAKARERRYLWSRTEFIDDALEWTGTGKEMFIGFVIVMAMLVPAALFLQFGIQALVLRGQFLAAMLSGAALYLAIGFLFGVALFRALRYRLSRTYWHGIRGGSDDAGWAYGGSALWRVVLCAFTLWLPTPWMMTRLWNERWGRMSFGPHSFVAMADSKGLKRRWFLIYVAVFAIAIAGGVAAVMMANPENVAADPAFSLSTLLISVLVYAVILFASLAYYAAYYRKVVGRTWLAGLDFDFTARTRDWLALILGNVGLVVVTLGIGIAFLGYRNWSFVVRHLEAGGEIDLATLTQSETRSASDAEGLASAFDIGAI